MKTATKIANESAFCEARRSMKKLEDELMSAAALSGPLHSIEQMIAKGGQEVLRAMMQAHIDQRAAQERAVEVKGTDGAKRKLTRRGTRQVETMFGEVEVERNLYQAPGVDGLAPLDAAMALPEEKYSYEVRRLIAEEAARLSFDEVVELVAKRTGAHVPKRQVEELTVRAAQDFDAFYGTEVNVAEESDDLLILSFDCKGVAMIHDDLRDKTRKAAAEPSRLHTRLTTGEKRNRKRMAQVATVYTIAPWKRTFAEVLHTLRQDRDVDAARPRPQNKRVWASVEHNAQRVVDDAFAEALRRDPDHRRSWVVLLDGQQDQIKRAQRAARKHGVQVTIVVDIVHVLEYLWRAAHAFHEAGSDEAEEWVGYRLHALLNGRSGGTVAKSMRLMSATAGLEGGPAAAVESAAKYLVRHTRWLHYDRALASGFPIATGVIEGACRYLVQDRMGRTGARWSLSGAEAILRLRALRTSDDFDAYWQFHLAKEHERTHRSRYADGVVPPVLPHPRPRLSLVK